jgi:hypothetical protein
LNFSILNNLFISSVRYSDIMSTPSIVPPFAEAQAAYAAAQAAFYAEQSADTRAEAAKTVMGAYDRLSRLMH